VFDGTTQGGKQNLAKISKSNFQQVWDLLVVLC